MSQAIAFLLDTFLGLFVLALLLRFFLQAVRAPARNPISNFVAALTDFCVRPARRFIPGLWGYDLSSPMLAWAVQIALVASVLAVKGYEFNGPVGAAVAGIILLSLVNLLKLLIYIVLIATIAHAVLSWVSPYSPAAPILNAMTRPYMRMFQRRVPAIGGVDLSPLFVLVFCQILLMWPVAYLSALFARMI